MDQLEVELYRVIRKIDKEIAELADLEGVSPAHADLQRRRAVHWERLMGIGTRNDDLGSDNELYEEL